MISFVTVSGTGQLDAYGEMGLSSVQRVVCLTFFYSWPHTLLRSRGPDSAEVPSATGLRVGRTWGTKVAKSLSVSESFYVWLTLGEGEGEGDAECRAVNERVENTFLNAV